MKRRKKLSKKLLVTVITACIAAAVSVALLITNTFIPVKYLSAYCVSADKNQEGDLRISFLNVGHGDCTLVEFPDGKTLLIDGGNGRYNNNLAVLRRLNSCGVDGIDYLVCTSVRGENCGGLSEVLRYKSVGTVYMPFCANTHITSEYHGFCEAVKAASDNGTQVKYCEYGEGVFTNGYGFCFLSPSVYDNPEGEYADLNKTPSNANIANASAVIWLECGNSSFLFLGNLLADKQKELCEIYKAGMLDVNGKIIDLPSCNVVKVANHGDKASACAELYDLILPEAAIISVGENARGCPDNSVVSDVLSRNAKLYRTDFDGTVTVKVSGDNRGIYKELQ